MWFGTYGQGISVYDGKRFSYYNKENGFPSENAWSIDKDSRGNLWIATSNGLVCFDGKKFRNYTKKDGLPGDAVLAGGGGFHCASQQMPAADWQA